MTQPLRRSTDLRSSADQHRAMEDVQREADKLIHFIDGNVRDWSAEVRESATDLIKCAVLVLRGDSRERKDGDARRELERRAGTAA